LKPSNVAPAVLGLNYESHNAPVYEIDNSAVSAEPCELSIDTALDDLE